MNKKIILTLGLTLLGVIVANGELSLTSNDIKKGTDKGYILSDNYTTYNDCNSTKDKYNQEFTNYKRGECFGDGIGYKYFICQPSDSCTVESGTNGVITTNIANTTIAKVSNQDKLDKFVLKIQGMKAELNDTDKYAKLLESVIAKLTNLGTKYKNNTTISEMVTYLQKGVTSIQEDFEKNKDVDSFFCELSGGCDNNTSDSIGTTSTNNIVSLNINDGIIACGDSNKSNYTTYSPVNKIVKIQKDYCNEKGGKVWTMCNGVQKNIKTVNSISNGDDFSCTISNTITNSTISTNNTSSGSKECSFNPKPYLDLGLTFTIDTPHTGGATQSNYNPVSPWKITLTSGGSSSATFDITGHSEYTNHDNIQYYNNLSTFFRCTNGILTTSNMPPNYSSIEVDILPSAKIEGGDTVYKIPNQGANVGSYPTGSTSAGYVSVPVKYTTFTSPQISLIGYEKTSNIITFSITNYADYMKMGTITLYNNGSVAGCFGLTNGGLHCGIATSGNVNGIFKMSLNSLKDSSYILTNGTIKKGIVMVIDGFSSSPDGSGGFNRMNPSNTIEVSDGPVFNLIRTNQSGGQYVEWTTANATSISHVCSNGSTSVNASVMNASVELNRAKTFTNWISFHNAGWPAGSYICNWKITGGGITVEKKETFILQ